MKVLAWVDVLGCGSERVVVVPLVVHRVGLRSGATVLRMAGVCVCDSCAQRCAMSGGRQCVGEVHDCKIRVYTLPSWVRTTVQEPVTVSCKPTCGPPPD